MSSSAKTHQRANSSASRQLDVNDLSDFESEIELDNAALPNRSSESPRPLLDNTADSSTDRWTLRHKIRAGAALALWYTFSILLSVYNKNMFSKSGINFPFPIITTSLHQLAQIVLSLVVIYAMKLPSTNLAREGRLKVIPASLASACDIGLGNCSLLVVTLSFYTMLKSSALGFVLLFSVLFGLEAPSLKLVIILAIMILGVFLMAAGEAAFSLLGFFLVLGASCSSGLRWALVKLLLNGGASAANGDDHSHNNENNGWKKPHPVQTIMMLSPGMFVGLLTIGCLVEGPIKFMTAPIWTDWSVPYTVLALIFPGILAFCMTWAEFDLLNTTGPLTLAIAGICKEVATIIVSVIVFKDHLSIVNTIGLFVTIIAIGLYHYHRSN